MSVARIPSVFLALLLSTAAACAPAASAGDDESSAEAELGSEATITFDKSFTHDVSGGTLQVGRTVNVVYDLDRLPLCRGEQGGFPRWSITGSYKIDGGPVKSFAVGGLALTNGGSSRIVLDRPGKLEVWFENTGISGCHAVDSHLGENWIFDVAAL